MALPNDVTWLIRCQGSQGGGVVIARCTEGRASPILCIGDGEHEGLLAPQGCVSCVGERVVNVAPFAIRGGKSHALTVDEYESASETYWGC